jgi:glycosyltransferase involved in cell wall biosynthesis
MGDRYEHDLEILETVDGLAELHQGAVGRPAPERRPGALRVAYLVYGAAHQGSVLVRLLGEFARHHRREKVEARFYVPESPRTARHAPYLEDLSANAALLEAAGATLICAEAADELEAWLATARAIREFDADVLVTAALLADYSHYFIAALRPARRIVGLGLGPPAQFAAPGLDWVVCATRHPMMDMPCDASVVEFETTPPERPGRADRSALGILAKAPLMVLAGRAHKFLDRGYWSALGRILDEHPEAWLLVLGLENPPGFLNEVFPPEARARFRHVGWRADYLSFLAMADVVLDTWPSGGGFVLTDAMAFGIPVAGMKNNYLRAFDQTAWNPAEEIVGVPGLMAPRGDFAAFGALVGKLLDDPAYRRGMGERCREHLLELRSDPARMVRRHEEIYERVAASAGERPACGLAHPGAAGRSALARRHDWGRAPRGSMLERALRRLRRALTS